MKVPLRVLVFGKNGQVGSSLVTLFSANKNFHVIGADIDDLDLTRTREITEFIKNSEPDWVVNTAAHTAVDRAEQEVDLSYLLNSEVPDTMSECCAASGIGFVHYSTDYVFDGEKDSPYIETDSPNPQSVYGASKLAGEFAVLRNQPDAIIFRTSWVYSRQGKNFVNTMLKLAQQQDVLRVVSDQYGCPTLADDLAMITFNVIDGISMNQFPSKGGIYHATGRGITSWYEFCKSVFALTGNDKITVEPITTGEFPTAARRPRFSVLSNQKLEATYNQVMPEWQEALNRCLVAVE